ncbi:HAD-IIA family hydrolase [Numidum massiliense]|uniref:HAD-IIA family hydrolase n=1 Tax=Numidum massiliense TaxID=1522315 RepID=UPI0006D57F09|nr:HAD-IIA family hydrolase [Numidum massiliense]
MTVLATVGGFIFDLDGTIYVGEQLIPGADEAINYLQSHGKRILFLTNKTIVSRDSYVQKLTKLGIDGVGLDQVLSPTLLTIRYLREKRPGARLFVIGEPLIKTELQQAGFLQARTPLETDVVVISWDREFHYDHLDFAYQAVKKGALTIATNPDRTCPVEGGDVPDCGAMIGALEGASGKKVDVIIGKPSPLMAQAALDLLQLPRHSCMIVGDRLETDILMGREVGIQTALVLTGITGKEQLASSTLQPDVVLESVADLVAFIKK